MEMYVKRILGVGLLAVLVAFTAIMFSAALPGSIGHSQAAYTPQTRTFTVVTVPTLTNEQAGVIPSYKDVVAKMGEVYTFFPDVLVVYQGDTVNLKIRNLQPDDPHTFTLDKPYDKVNVTIAPNAEQDVSFTATDVGTFEFYCAVTNHLPYMYGELVVLPDSMGGGYQNK
jgi:plastocyanin